jgi:T4-like virus Myoviridae tail sheath stabiliser
MLGNYFYNKCITKTVTAFGTLFNNIQIRHFDENNQPVSILKVPLSYGPMQKFLARLEQNPSGDRKIALTLPRMSFEMTSIDYDPTRKVSAIQTFKSTKIEDGKAMNSIFMPVPYNIGFELNIISKIQDDALQIIEQILPFFQPSFNVTITMISSIGEKKDIPIVLNKVGFRDDYEGDYSSRRTIIYTLNFTAKTYLFNEIPEDNQGIIKKVQVDYSTDAIKNAKREVRYTVTPKALEDYNDDGVIDSVDDDLIEYGDDFGFNETIEDFVDFKTFSTTQGSDVDL